MKKLPANTLLEVIVALVILTFMFTLATYFFVSMNNHLLNYEEVKADSLFTEFVSQSELDDEREDESVQQSGFLLVRTVNYYREYTNLLDVRYKLYNSRHDLIRQKNVLRLLETKAEVE